MNCTEARNLLMAYLDSELDARASAEVGEHLDACASCARRFAAEGRLEGALLEALRDEPMPAEVWASTLGRVRREGQIQPWWRWAAVAAALVLALGLALRVDDGNGGLMREMIRLHTGVASGGAPLDLVSGERAALEAFLEERSLDGLPIPAAGEVQGHPVELVGVREVTLGGQPAANVLVRCCDLPTSLFVMRRDRLDALPDEWQRAIGDGPVSEGDLQAQALVTEDHLVSLVWHRGHETPVLPGVASL